MGKGCMSCRLTGATEKWDYEIAWRLSEEKY